LNDDEFFLKRAVQLAGESVAKGSGGPFGAVIVRAGKIIGEGWNQVVPNHDPTAHAEVQAIRAACASENCFHLTGCILYASSEPCPMCLSAAYWARISRIVFANPRAVAAAIGFCDDELYDELRLPHGERRMLTIHLPIADADTPLISWYKYPARSTY
jgi:tRNA(Arg) A34 adenosine deaminase TadA